VDRANTEQARRWRGQDGFTISELILVVVVVAGLLVVATVSVRNIRSETSTSNCQTDLRTLKLATEQYRAQNDAYPVDKSVLIDDGLVDADQVSRWTVEFEGGADAPTYRAVDDACR
jgi:prepilin-type N-terminal cleavage/methylation domain-containing protein